MGYDKPDLGFVVHYQAPGSVISYYQQVGRAGRAVSHADVVLLRGQEDKRIQDFFIEQAFPPREVVDRVLEALGEEGATLPAILAQVNLGRGRIEAMLKVLDVEGAVERHGTKWVRRTGTDWATTRSAMPRSPRCGAPSRRRWRSSAPMGAASCARCRRSSTIPTRRTAGAAPCAWGRGLRSRPPRSWCARPTCTCAPSRWCSRSRRWLRMRTGRCASWPTRCAPRRGGRSRGWVTAAGIRWCGRVGRPDGLMMSSSGRRRRSCARGSARPRARPGCVPSRRTAVARSCRTLRGGSRRR